MFNSLNNVLYISICFATSKKSDLKENEIEIAATRTSILECFFKLFFMGYFFNSSTNNRNNFAMFF
jgi:hypothetical protein